MTDFRKSDTLEIEKASTIPPTNGGVKFKGVFDLLKIIGISTLMISGVYFSKTFLDYISQPPIQKWQGSVISSERIAGYDFDKDGILDRVLWRASIGTPRLPNYWIQGNNEDFQKLQAVYSNKFFGNN